jgi:hypothetical protein
VNYYSWRYLNRPETIHHNASVGNSFEYIYHWSALWGLIFCLMYPTYPYIIQKLFPTYYKNLDENKKKDFSSYCVATTHHLVVVPFAIYYLYLDILRNDFESSQTNFAELYCIIVPFVFGYFIADNLMYSVPQFFAGHYDYFLHHLVSIILILGMINVTGNPLRFIPHLMICEVSTLFFNFAWFIRKKDRPKTSFIKFLEYMFAITFFLTRNINMPCMLYALRESLFKYPIIGAVFVPIVFLQYFWLYKIIHGLTKPSVDKTAKKKEQ